MDRFVRNTNANSSSEPPPLRQPEAYVNLTTAVHKNPFTDALITFLVICQMALSLVANEVFLEFLEQLYPAIRKIPQKRVTAPMEVHTGEDEVDVQV
jgi:hypothetical protein